MKEDSELKTAEQIVQQMVDTMPYSLKYPIIPYILEAMEVYALQYKDRPTPVVETKTAEEIQKLDRCYNLLPCPFCGGKEGEAVVMGYKYPHYRASCMDCGYFISDDRTDKVVYHWNRRSFTPSAKSVEVEEAAYGDWLLRPTQSEFKNRHISAFTRGSNWQQQKQSDTISRMTESLHKILRTPSKSDCDLIVKEALKEK